MMILKDILPTHVPVQCIGNAEVPVLQLTLDSRAVEEGYLFAAIIGDKVDGHQFIATAIEKGASVILCQNAPAELVDSCTYVVTADVPEVLGHMASTFHGSPSKWMDIIAVTGTNGKTTITNILCDLFTQLGYKCGLIGTIGISINGQWEPATHTTPDSVSLQALLGRMLAADVEMVFMEVSSHALVQKRTAGTEFKAGIFTNLTHDHLDYHGTFANYRDAKKLLFDGLGSDAFAIANIDDKNAKYMLQNCKASKFYYGIQNTADFKAKVLEADLFGMELLIGDAYRVYSPMPGLFNAGNILAAYALARCLEISDDDLVLPISKLKGVKGRFEVHSLHGITFIIDYAHTPDALEKTMESIHELNTAGAPLYTVVGCGGNRDATKRPIMAKIAAENSSTTILTSDNPRFEDPELILDEMEAGLTAYAKQNVLRITDRRQAIKTAIHMAKAKSIILIAGKGHEAYQEIQGNKLYFSDYAVALELVNELKAPQTN